MALLCLVSIPFRPISPCAPDVDKEARQEQLRHHEARRDAERRGHVLDPGGDREAHGGATVGHYGAGGVEPQEPSGAGGVEADERIADEEQEEREEALQQGVLKV